MTPDDHLRLLIGDLVLRVAQLAAENDALKAQLTPAPEPPKPETPNA